jgi:hypothetical protein
MTSSIVRLVRQDQAVRDLIRKKVAAPIAKASATATADSHLHVSVGPSIRTMVSLLTSAELTVGVDMLAKATASQGDSRTPKMLGLWLRYGKHFLIVLRMQMDKAEENHGRAAFGPQLKFGPPMRSCKHRSHCLWRSPVC